jgi:dolichol-phosphate mannosyltransferase
VRAKPLYSIIIPVFNEEKVLKEFWSRLEKVVIESQKTLRHHTEVIFIDDGSTDDSPRILLDLKKQKKTFEVRIVTLSRNFGHQAALMCGYEVSKGECVLSIDADLQDPPELIPNFFSHIGDGWDIVLGQRIERSGESNFKRFSAYAFYRLLNLLSSTKIPTNVADFRCVSRRSLDAFLSMKEVDPYLRGMFAWIGFNQICIRYTRDPRFAGETKYSLKKMIKLARNGIIGFSGNPMRIPFYLSFLFMIFGFSLSIYLFVSKIINPSGSEPGYTSLMVLISFAFSLQLFILGLIGEYLLKNLSYSQRRPEYLILGEN